MMRTHHGADKTRKYPVIFCSDYLISQENKGFPRESGEVFSLFGARIGRNSRFYEVKVQTFSFQFLLWLAQCNTN